MKFKLLAAVAASALVGTAANATLLLFQLQGYNAATQTALPAGSNYYTASFTLDTTATPLVTLANQLVRYTNIPVTFSRPGSATVQTINQSPPLTTGPTFFTASNSGGLFVGNIGGFPTQFRVFGPQLFTGTITNTSANVTFSPGTYYLSDVQPARLNDPLQVNYRLLITEVPEPASWAMMIGGFGMIGQTFRRRRGLAKVA